jgi:hypothetical protein
LIVLVPQFGHGLAEINLDSAIVNQCIIHFEIGLDSGLFVGEFGKCVLQGSTSLLIANDLHLDVFIKTRKNQLEIFIDRHRIEFANKQDIFRCSNVGIGQVAQHF